jgi:hypothetical protein
LSGKGLSQDLLLIQIKLHDFTFKVKQQITLAKDSRQKQEVDDG